MAVAGGDGLDTRVLTSTPDRGVAGSSPTAEEEVMKYGFMTRSKLSVTEV